MADIEIKRATFEDREMIFDLVWDLLCELGEEAADLNRLRWKEIQRAWMDHRNDVHVFIATKDGAPIGVVTLAETFAIFANGALGVINEMYVVPEERSQGIGQRLLEAASRFGQSKGWKRLDVTMPESERFARTRQFYERESFQFTGPKLKRTL